MKTLEVLFCINAYKHKCVHVSLRAKEIFWTLPYGACVCVVPGLCLSLAHSLAAMLDRDFKEALCWEHRTYFTNHIETNKLNLIHPTTQNVFHSLENCLVTMATAKFEQSAVPVGIRGKDNNNVRQLNEMNHS